MSLLLLTSTIVSASENNTIQSTISEDNDNLNVDVNSVPSISKNILGENQKTSSNIIINSSNFDDYVTEGQFNDKVIEGDQIDFQGIFEGSKYALNVNKPVNILSSTHDAYFNFHTGTFREYGESNGGIFQITKEGSGTNITDITFYTTRVSIENTSNVRINNISCLDVDANIGNGVGSFTVREGSENVTVTNSYFMTRGNGGHSNVVFAAAYNCLFENNTIEGYGDKGLIGNLLYLTTYNVQQANPKTNINITIRNNTLRSYNADNYATCYGLALEGTGHIIEGNIIDNAFPVMAQYADADYDFETNIDGIIFNNNTIIRSTPQLVFPGIVSNNKFYDGATLKQVHAYNNTFNTVTLQDNVKFENNTAVSVNIKGNNNILNNNEVYSSSEYAITVSGENNSINNNQLFSDVDFAVKLTGTDNLLSNNKIASFSNRGMNAIDNSTEYVSIDNDNQSSRIYYITNDNIEKYFIYQNARQDIFNSTIMNDDIFVFNTSLKNNRQISFGLTTRDPINLTIENSTVNFQTFTLGNITTIKNSFITSVLSGSQEIFLINSTISYTTIRTIHNVNSTILSDYPSNNTYIMGNSVSSALKLIIDYNTGKFVDTVNDSATILLFNYDSDGQTTARYYVKDIYIDKPVNIITTKAGGHIDVNVHFIEGSQGSTVTGVDFDGDVEFTSNIRFINCSFNKETILNNVNTLDFEGNEFNNKISMNNTNFINFYNNKFSSEELPITINSSKNNIFENNTVITNDSFTIKFDNDSINNIVKYNYLVASELMGDDTVINIYNDIADNTPSYKSQIILDLDENTFVGESLPVTVIINNLYNNTPVTKGFVKLYYDSIFQGEKELTSECTVFDINLTKMGNFPIDIWYNEGIKYDNAFLLQYINVIKSDVSITVDEFTAKLNEKATITTTFLNEKGNPVQDTNVTFNIGRTTFTVETVDGVATLDEIVTKEWLDSGKLTVSFPSTDAYNSNTTTVTLNTTKDDVAVTPDVTVDGARADIKLTLTDSLGNPVTDGRVTIKTLDGSSELASGRVTNGVYTASVTLPEDYTEEYLLASYTGSYYYNDFERNVKITQMLNSTISLDTNSPLYGEELVITGRLVDSKNTPIGGANLTLNLNGSKVIVTTNDDGEYNYTYTPGLGVNSLTVTFDGTVDIYGSSASKDVTIRDTDRDMNEVLNQLDELTAENARLQEQLDNLTQLSNDLKEQLANQTGELSEQNAALQQQIDTLSTIIGALTDIINSQNEQINSLNEQIAALTAPENTTIIFNDVVDARYKSDVVISGMLTSQKGMALSGQTVTLTVGDKTVDVTTKNGEFEYTTVFKSVGEQTVTASYAGSDNYVASDASVTFDVAKQDVVVTVDPIADSAYGDNVTITGKFSDVDGKAISNSNVRVFVNGKKFLAKTDKTGAYSLSAKVTSVGENNVTVGYGGNDNYNAYEDTITFNADKQDVIVTVDAIEDTKVGENVTITGTFTDKNGKAIINSNVKILINGKKYLAKTDSTGAYTFTTKVTAAGINNITVGYSGNDKYNAYEDATTFNADAQDVIVTVNPVEEVTVGKNVTITGTFTDKYGKAVTNSNVRIILNGKKYYAKTDSTGAYTFTTTVTTEGINNITAGYGGSAKYNACETNTTFVAKAE